MNESIASPGSTDITVKLVFLARLRDAFESSGETMVLQETHPTVGLLLAMLRARTGPWATELAPGRAVRIAVNHEVTAESRVLKDGDEVAFLPPVTGG